MQEQGWYLSAGPGSTLRHSLALRPRPLSHKLSSNPDLIPILNLKLLPHRRPGSPPQSETQAPLLNRHPASSGSLPYQTHFGLDRDPLRNSRRVLVGCLTLWTPVITSPLPWRPQMKRMNGKGKRNCQIWLLRVTVSGNRRHCLTHQQRKKAKCFPRRAPNIHLMGNGRTAQVFKAATPSQHRPHSQENPAHR